MVQDRIKVNWSKNKRTLKNIFKINIWKTFKNELNDPLQCGNLQRGLIGRN